MKFRYLLREIKMSEYSGKIETPAPYNRYLVSHLRLIFHLRQTHLVVLSPSSKVGFSRLFSYVLKIRKIPVPKIGSSSLPFIKTHLPFLH